MKNEVPEERNSRLTDRIKRQALKNDDSKLKNIFRAFILVVIISGVICLIVFGFYIYNFHGYSISKNPADWGPFGSYISGVLGPILSFLNMALIIYVTLRIFHFEHASNKLSRRLEQEINERAIQIQKKIVLSDMRQNSFKELTNFLESGRDNLINEIIKEEDVDEEKIELLIKKMGLCLAQFKRNNSHSFRPLREEENNMEGLFKSLETISAINSEYIKIIKAGENEEEAFKKLNLELENFQRESSKLILKLQDFILDELGR